MQIWCPGCVRWNFLKLWYSFIVLETKIRSTNRPWKIIYSDFGLTAQQGFRGPYLLALLSELGLPHVQIDGMVEAHNFSSQTFAIKGRLNLWICTKRSCCPGLREYLSGWVDLVGKHPSPRSFACWCFGPWVVWSHVHFVSWLVMGFMIFSWSAWWTYPESLLFNVNFLRKQQTPKSTWKCELVTSLVCLVAG
jgi:hypothetical protein